MKRSSSFFILFIFLCIFVQNSYAITYTQTTWEQRCRSKLKRDTTLYEVEQDPATGEVLSCTPIGTLPAGTYVNPITKYYSAKFSVVEIYYYVNGIEHHDWCDSNAIISAVRYLWFTDGGFLDVPEALTFDLNAVYNKINITCPGHTLFAITTTD